jgi:hypothetical protein
VSDGHVYVAASGFGLCVIPKCPPYRYTLAPEGAALDVERGAGESWLFARVIPEDGGYKSKLAPNTSALVDVLDVTVGPQWDRWWLETSVYRLPLLASWTALSGSGPSMFDLIAPSGALIFVQTPSRLGLLSEVRTQDQRVLSTGRDAQSEWVDLGYAQDGIEWRQRHWLRRLGGVNIVTTAQARVDAMQAAIAAQAELVDAVEVRGASIARVGRTLEP